MLNLGVALYYLKNNLLLGMAVSDYNPNTWETDAATL